jgi:pyruvate formate lyase activating enzyme
MKSFVPQNTAAETVASLAARPTREEFNSLAVSGTVYDIQRFSINDGPGIRTIVFFKACPLRCLWCSNPESQSASPELFYFQSRCLHCGECVKVCPEAALSLVENNVTINRARCAVCDICSLVCPSGALRVTGRRMNVKQVLSAVARDNVFYKHSGGGMTLSGGEPLAQPAFALTLLHGAREQGIHTAVETTGYASADVARSVLGACDLILYDIKQLNPTNHLAGTGVSNARILDNACLAASLGVRMIIRVPVIPGFNDAPEDLVAIGRFALELGITELHLLPYHNFGVTKYSGLGRVYLLPDTPLLSTEQILSLRQTLQELGIKVCVGG